MLGISKLPMCPWRVASRLSLVSLFWSKLTLLCGLRGLGISFSNLYFVVRWNYIDRSRRHGKSSWDGVVVGYEIKRQYKAVEIFYSPGLDYGN